MALFDFLKKKEFTRISELEHISNQRLDEIRDLQEKCKSQENQISILSHKVAELEKYQGISDINMAISKLYNKLQRLKNLYKEKFALYIQLKNKCDLYNEDINFIDKGLYKPEFNYDTSQEYKEKIYENWEKQKALLKNFWPNSGLQFSFGYSHFFLNDLDSAWKQFQKDIDKTIHNLYGTTQKPVDLPIFELQGNVNHIRVLSRTIYDKLLKTIFWTFNIACSYYNTKINWNNADKYIKQLEDLYDSLNWIGYKKEIFIDANYKDLKIQELQLTYEYKLKLHQEKEEQRAIREQMREEEKARREIDAAIHKANKDEETYRKALERARQEILSSVGEKQEKMRLKIQELEARLAETEVNKERALSMAQQTKRGHVYVISNIGSFGENIYKIGMTRRLDPMDRVRELGDASVPFPFDVHAIIYTDDAPTLEAKLHKIFERNRLNLMNPRKEFFRASLDDIEKAARDAGATVEFTKTAEARDYRESQAIREQGDKAIEEAERNNEFRESLFDEDDIDFPDMPDFIDH